MTEHSNKLGTPLQAVKFALQLRSGEHEFLAAWTRGLEAQDLTGPWGGFVAFCASNPDEPEREDGRKVHYGSERQPWDDIKEVGWGPEFCAGNVLKYIRRHKEVEESWRKAAVYYSWLRGLESEVQPDNSFGSRALHAFAVRTQLRRLLSEKEKVELRGVLWSMNLL